LKENTMKKHSMKTLAAAACLAVLMPLSAMASCVQSTATGYVHISFGTVTVPASLPVGGVIAQQSATVDGEIDVGVQCTGEGAVYLWTNDGDIYGTPVGGMANTYTTNIPGVGYQVIKTNYTNGYFNNPPLTFPTTSSMFRQLGSSYLYQVNLIKVSSKVSSGNLVTGQIADVKDDNGSQFLKINIASGTIQGPH
jgi:hypothetical protein